MYTKLAVLSLLALRALGSVVPEQQPLDNNAHHASGPDASDVLYELEKAEIIPTVLDSFLPSINLTIFWANATSELGNTVDPSLMQRHPDATGYLFPGVELSNKIQLVMGVTDPDAPSRDNPEWSEICHWLAVLKQDRDDDSDSDSDGAVDAFDKKKYYELMEYKPPGPPPKTGKHRYVFVLLAPINRTTEALHLTKPADRQHWGYKEERQGLRKWASNHGLEPIGVNFIYSQNEEQ